MLLYPRLDSPLRGSNLSPRVTPSDLIANRRRPRLNMRAVLEPPSWVAQPLSAGPHQHAAACLPAQAEDAARPCASPCAIPCGTPPCGGRQPAGAAESSCPPEAGAATGGPRPRLGVGGGACAPARRLPQTGSYQGHFHATTKGAICAPTVGRSSPRGALGEERKGRAALLPP
ncbi:hypothetical protein ONE63_009589 [Megalurothrips usitatus]|uniref:Uncharacterized protein n=1 Tax=Megalurothrips usitatus TaxID=439358 RepID=A0AAV7XNP5_9NEOP|nr:hypothetical protein ONE63_009589 [Megalurothrips usitatus]